MTTSDRIAVVTVPFPYVEQDAAKRRPALLVSSPEFHDRHGLGWVLMITSAGNEPWADDISIADLPGAGLRAPSVIRPSKIATVELKRLKHIGMIDGATTAVVRQYLGTTLRLIHG